MNLNRLRHLALSGALLICIGCFLTGCFLFPGGPKAVIEVSVTEGFVPLTVDFDGSASTGPAGISTYTWDFGTGDPDSHDVSGSYTYEHAGTFTLGLTVRAEDGSTNTNTVTITVKPAVWITDENLGRIYKLDMEGNQLDSFDLPVTEPRGITIAEANGRNWLFVACSGGGIQRILRIDPTNGSVSQQYGGPSRSPLNLTFGASEPKRIWLVDGVSRKLYGLNRTDCQVYDLFGASSFGVGASLFLRTPEGLDWTPEQNASGHLWYLEGETHLLYKIKIIPGYDIMSGTQLDIVGTPLEITASVFPVSGIDFYDDYLWVIDVNNHRIVQIDTNTGMPTGTEITAFPGASPAGLEIQH